MYVDINYLVLGIILALIFSIIGSIKQKESVAEFIPRFAFIGFFNTIVVLIVSYLGI